MREAEVAGRDVELAGGEHFSDTPPRLRLRLQVAAYGRLVGLTGIIYAAIVVAWAAFLVPLALRRHDQAPQKRSVERFSSTMRVLSTGGRRPSSRSDEGLPSDAGTSGSTRTSTVPEAHGATRLERFPSRAARRAAAARRRRVLRVLVALTLFTGAASVAAVLPVWSPALPVAFIVVFLVVARRQVRLANERYWQRAAKVGDAPSTVVRRSDARESSGPSLEAAPAPGDDVPTVDMPAVLSGASPALAQQRVTAVPVPTVNGNSLWDPLPITLPTYVDKPVAKRVVRKIEIGSPEATTPSGSAAPAKAAAPATDQVTRSAEHASTRPAADTADDAPRAANA